MRSKHTLCARTLPMPLVGVVELHVEPDDTPRDDSEHRPHPDSAVQSRIWCERLAGMARRGKGSDAQWLAGALLDRYQHDARAVLRRWVVDDGPRRTWGAADELLARVGLPERVQVDAFA